MGLGGTFKGGGSVEDCRKGLQSHGVTTYEIAISLSGAKISCYSGCKKKYSCLISFLSAGFASDKESSSSQRPRIMGCRRTIIKGGFGNPGYDCMWAKKRRESPRVN